MHMQGVQQQLETALDTTSNPLSQESGIYKDPRALHVCAKYIAMASYRYIYL
jgi:hypothetical protein